MILRIVLFCGALLSPLVVAGCGGGAGAGASGETSIVASFYPLAFAARQVAGPDASVVNLTAAGVEPHDLELTARQARELAGADVVLYLGQGFQPAVESALESRTGPSIDLLAGRQLSEGPGGERSSGLDPHVWLDPIRYAAIVREIGEAVRRPAAAAALEARLRDLDAEFASGLAHCARRAFVTSHAAFGYLAARYGLVQIPLAGLSPEAEPSPRALEALARQVRRTGATTVFFETLVPGDLARTVAREAGVATATLDPLEGLTDDESAAGADYFSVMRDDLAALREALGCR